MLRSGIVFAAASTLFLGIAFADNDSGSECDRVIPRAAAVVPDLGGPAWPLQDQGFFQFKYRFFSRQGSERISAMEVAGEYVEGIQELKLSWEVGDEIYAFRKGPQGDYLKEPVCVRRIRDDFTLDKLYRILRARLERTERPMPSVN